MTFEKLKEWTGIVSAAIIAVSAMHVVAASIYLYFYCVGFGANLSMFYSAPDIFSISITKLANVYLRSLVWPVLVFGGLKLSGLKNNAEWVAAAPTPERAERRKRSNEIVVVVLMWLFGLTFVVTSARVGIDWWNGRVASGYAMFSSLSLAGVLVTVNRLGHVPLAMSLGLFFAAGLIGGAIDNGQLDRHATYASTRSLPTCRGFKMLGRASAYYLAVGNKDTKVLLKEDCKVAFVFPRPVIR